MTSVQRPTLASPLRDAVGAKTANALADKLDLHTVGELLHHYPRRYAERGEVSDLGALEIGEHVDRPDVLVLRGRRVAVTGGPVDLDADGEVEEGVPARTWRVRRHGWSVLVPPPR